MDMGFGIEGCKRAVYNTKNQGILLLNVMIIVLLLGVEPAMNWILEHMEDPGSVNCYIILYLCRFQ